VAARKHISPFPQPQENIMRKVLGVLHRFLQCQDGPTAVEYAVMLALIVIVCIAAIGTVGTNATSTFTNMANSMSGS
jgi:pilus assembly protein Flp/PilA